MNTDALKHLPALLLPWYKENARALPWRKDTDPYHVWISEIMLQQTRAEAVQEYYTRFIEAFPNISTLAQAQEKKLLKLWEGLGYYNRAKNLQKASREIVYSRDGVFPQTYAEILSLPGIGPYTAGAVSSICFDLPTPAVDGNVLRVVTRLTENSAPIQLQNTKKEIHTQLEKIYPKTNRGDFTQALMELGATVCTPQSPKCEKCPAADICAAYQKHSVSKYPVKLPKKEKKQEERTLFYFLCNGKIALTKRGGSGLLSGLWQFPNIKGTLSLSEALSAAETFGTEPTEILKERHEMHIFTHIKWDMTCYYLRCRRQPDTFSWETFEEIQNSFPLPTAFRKFLEKIE